MDCIKPKFTKLSCCMIWSAVSGLYGPGKSPLICFVFLFLHYNNAYIHLGPLVSWDPKWGKIDREGFIRHIIPVLDEYMRSHDGLIF